MTDVYATRIGIGIVRNGIVIEWDEPPIPHLGAVEATIDIGVRGTLIGVELADTYLHISADETAAAAMSRTSAVVVDTEPRRLTLRRRTDAYAFAWPAGNQCWRQRTPTGTIETCAVILDPSDR